MWAQPCTASIPLFVSPGFSSGGWSPVRASQLSAAELRRRPCFRRPILSASLPSSVGVTTDERTGTTIYVIGCVHGSRVSAADVATVLESTNPDAVVLELCDARLRSLRKDMSRRASSRIWRSWPDNSSPSARGDYVSEEPPSVHDYIRQPVNVRSTFSTFKGAVKRFGGVGPALLAMCLTFVYKVQMLVGIDPGTEFKTAIAMADAADCDITCGDVPATETIRNLYSTFTTPFRSLMCANETIGALVQRVVYLPAGGVNILKVLIQRARAQEFARLALPLFTIGTAFTAATSTGSLRLEEGLAIFATIALRAELAEVLSVAGPLLEMVFVSYIIVSSLHFIKVLITDRDAVICNAILETAQRVRSGGQSKTAVCAVVGLMHVNGILRYMQKSNKEYRQEGIALRNRD